MGGARGVSFFFVAGPWLFWWAATSNGNAWPRPAPFLPAPLLLPSLLSLPLLFLHRAWLFLHCAWLCLHRAWLFLHCARLFLHCADATKMAQAPPACCPTSFEPEGQGS